MSLLAVDIGSSSCKAVAFSDDGFPLTQKTCPYAPFQSRHRSWAEIPAETFWRAFANVTQAITSELDKDPVEALAISSHGESFVPVDSRYQAISPAILNIDSRALAEADTIAQHCTPKSIFQITGLTVHPMYPLAKILWLREHEPQIFSGTARFLAIPSYLLTRLRLPAYIDYSLASRFLLFDIHKHSWSSEILCGFDLCAEQLPIAVPAGTIAGELSQSAAADLGLTPGTLVVVGGHDQPCGALGCGVVDPGRVSASLGTYECLLAASPTPVLDDNAFAANLNSYCHVVPDRYVTLAYFPAGIMLSWFLGILTHRGELTPAAVETFCRDLEMEANEGPTGLCITPHLLGTCNPDFNPQASGVIAGIRPGTTRGDLYKGILEGIACEFANMADLLEQTAGEFTDIYVSGGGSHSRLGLMLRASLSHRRLHQMECSEIVCQGTAMLAAVAAGKYSGLADTVQQFVRVSQTTDPDPSISETYEKQSKQYRLLYSSLSQFRRAEAQCS
ncbi:MAG TPA: FGGY-family carbohydrate kinase [Terriglobales bacterium]|nr:FGGY-family carbohydrate kinase [Terriglobales bacterium]